MSIERSNTAPSPKAVAGAENSKGKVKSAGEGGSEGGGFSAILTSLESPPVQAEVASEEVAVDDAAPSSESTAAEALVTPALAMPLDMAMLLAQASEVAAGNANVPLTPPAAAVPSDVAMLLAQAGEVAADQLTPTAGDGRPLAVAGLRSGAKTTGTDKPDVASRLLAPAVGDKTEDLPPNVNALLAQAHKTRGAELQAAAAVNQAEARVLRQSSAADAMARESALSGAVLTSGLGEDLLRQADRSSANASTRSSPVAGLESSWGQPAFQTASHVDAPTVVADPALLSLETSVADTVSYWVTQGVQNAELKLDGFGGEPIAVSISLRGNEASINFRTDQPEARQVLEGAVAHLKDLLTSEGLVLSGVSVGGSNQGAAGEQDPRNRQGAAARQASVVTPNAAPLERLQRTTPAAGRALDLYV